MPTDTADDPYLRARLRVTEDPEGYWLDAARAVDWIQPPTVALDASQAPLHRWFPDGTLNTCFNAVDRHVRDGHGDRPAIIHESPVTETSTTMTYSDLLRAVSVCAGAMRRLGVARGDTVLIYMPMVPEAVVAMLACARIGAVHSVVFGGFAANELAARIDDAAPTLVLSASCGVEPTRIVPYKPLLDAAVAMSTAVPPRCVVLQRPMQTAALDPARDLDWHDFLALGADQPAECVELAATDPLYVLYTSGTTAKPKGIVRDNGGHAVAMTWALPNIFDVGPGEVMWAASDIGWVVGHSFIVYAPLLTGATTVLYEGKPVGTPDAAQFWRVVERHAVKALFTAPTAIRAIRKEDPDGSGAAVARLDSLQTLFLAGERLDPATYEWAGQVLGVPVVDNWWQTETGWPIAANLRGLAPMPIKPGSPTVPVPGFDVRILDTDGREVGPGQEGAICLKLPLPPGCLLTVWGDEHRFRSSYLSAFEGYYATGDGGFVDEDGYLQVMGRTDDVINVAGHRLSTGAIEAVLTGHPAVVEAAVVGVHDELKGQLPHGFITIRSEPAVDREQLRTELVALVRDRIGPVASFRTTTVHQALPKTRSGKILRKVLRDLHDGAAVDVPPTIEDPAVLERIRQELHTR
ncbi:AMP-binding protein [Nakamurella leprariae]|uniref:AMP-binding protein n=1 Tax=Nakamurella leprariae TaxID=2803911 RepID=A0A938Y445_9ACTN|nr:AMP-binding protein [Nakamurella leprariae]MBM9465706.1 AMP-binding protein [Nakamurella leprariae]